MKNENSIDVLLQAIKENALSTLEFIANGAEYNGQSFSLWKEGSESHRFPEILSALTENTSIHSLLFFQTSLLNKECSEALINALKVNNSIQSFSMTHCLISAEDQTALFNILATKKTLLNVTLNYVHAQAVTHLIKTNTSIVTFEIPANQKLLDNPRDMMLPAFDANKSITLTNMDRFLPSEEASILKAYIKRNQAISDYTNQFLNECSKLQLDSESSRAFLQALLIQLLVLNTLNQWDGLNNPALTPLINTLNDLETSKSFDKYPALGEVHRVIKTIQLMGVNAPEHRQLIIKQAHTSFLNSRMHAIMRSVLSQYLLNSMSAEKPEIQRQTARIVLYWLKEYLDEKEFQHLISNALSLLIDPEKGHADSKPKAVLLTRLEFKSIVYDIQSLQSLVKKLNGQAYPLLYLRKACMSSEFIKELRTRYPGVTHWTLSDGLRDMIREEGAINAFFTFIPQEFEPKEPLLAHSVKQLLNRMSPTFSDLNSDHLIRINKVQPKYDGDSSTEISCDYNFMPVYTIEQIVKNSCKSIEFDLRSTEKDQDAALIEALTKNTSIIDATWIAADETRMSATIGALQHNQALKTLNFSSNTITLTVAKEIAALIQCPQIRSVSFDGNTILDEAIPILAKACSKSTHLSHFTLKQNNINDTQGLFKALKSLSLTSIDVSHNKLDDNAALIIAELSRIPSLRSLNLNDNNFSHNGIIVIAKALAHNKTISSLNMKNTNMGRIGALSLFGILQRHTGINILNVSYNLIDHQGIIAFCEALGENHSLRTISFSQDYSSKEILSITNALKKNYTLLELDGIPKNEAINAYLQRNKDINAVETKCVIEWEASGRTVTNINASVHVFLTQWHSLDDHFLNDFMKQFEDFGDIEKYPLEEYPVLKQIHHIVKTIQLIKKHDKGDYLSLIKSLLTAFSDKYLQTIAHGIIAQHLINTSIENPEIQRCYHVLALYFLKRHLYDDAFNTLAQKAITKLSNGSMRIINQAEALDDEIWKRLKSEGVKAYIRKDLIDHWVISECNPRNKFPSILIDKVQPPKTSLETMMKALINSSIHGSNAHLFFNQEDTAKNKSPTQSSHINSLM